MTHSCVNLRSRVRCFSPAVWPPIRRAHDPRRPDGGGDREGERAQCRDGGGRPSFARQRAAGWELGRREGRREGEKREKRKKISGTAAGAAAAASAADGENDHQSYWLRQTEGARHSLHRGGQHAARNDAATDGQAGTVATELCRASVVPCVVASRPHLRITQRAMQTRDG